LERTATASLVVIPMERQRVRDLGVDDAPLFQDPSSAKPPRDDTDWRANVWWGIAPGHFIGE
jgi:hypothetical protein